MISKNLELIIDRKNRNSFEQNTILICVLEILNRTWWIFNCVNINLYVFFNSICFFNVIFAHSFTCDI